MAINKETPTWYDGIYQLEENDSPYGGVGGTTNIQFVQLACRTRYLFDLLRNLYAASVSGRSCSSWRVEKAIPAETIVNLPIEYVVGARALMLFSDITGEIGPKYYSELGIIGSMSTQVKFTFEVPAGAVLTAFALATSVDKITYDGKYKYNFAWSELHYLFAMSTTNEVPTNIDYNTACQYGFVVDDTLGIARVVEGEDIFDTPTKASEQMGSFALTASFYDTKSASEDFYMQVTRNAKTEREDIFVIDTCAGAVDDTLSEQSKITMADTLPDIDEDLQFDVWRNGVIEKVSELDDAYDTEITDNLHIITNRNLVFDEEYRDEMDSLRVKGEVVTDFTESSYGALEKGLVLNITQYGSGDNIYLTDIYGGADDSDLVVIASKN